MTRVKWINTLRGMAPEALDRFSEMEQQWANRLQSLAAQAQSRADAARKEMKRRKREKAA